MLGHTTTAYVKLMVALNLSLGVCLAFMFTKLALPLVLYAQTVLLCTVVSCTGSQGLDCSGYIYIHITCTFWFMFVPCVDLILSNTALAHAPSSTSNSESLGTDKKATIYTNCFKTRKIYCREAYNPGGFWPISFYDSTILRSKIAKSQKGQLLQLLTLK